MKNFLGIFFVLVSGSAMAQESCLKAGANINFTFQTYQDISNSYHPVYPGFNVSYERSFGTRFSWLMNIEYDRPVEYYSYDLSFPPFSVSRKDITSRFSLIPEI